MTIFNNITTAIKRLTQYFEVNFFTMGASESKAESSEVPVGHHTPLPQDVQPYQGSALECLVIKVPVEMKKKINEVVSDIDDHYPAISGYLQQGYSLNTFCPLPKSVGNKGFNSLDIIYGAIFSRPFDAGTRRERGSLMVEKSIMQFMYSGMFRRERVADTSDIMQKITHHTSRGGRLMCLQFNCAGLTRGMNFSMDRGIGVDILFDIPRQPSEAKYAYEAISVPFSVTATMSHQSSQCDWLGTFLSHLKRGWKLVNVFIDGSRERNGREFTVNSIWFFEKEVSKLQDLTPIYDGVIIEYIHKVSVRGSVKTDWSPVIFEMGRRGWELACVQESGEMGKAGFTNVEIKLNMFFQRKIVHVKGEPPPSYSSLPPPLATALPNQASPRLQPYTPSEAPSTPPSYRSTEDFD